MPFDPPKRPHSDDPEAERPTNQDDEDQPAADDGVNHNSPEQAVRDHMHFGESESREEKKEREAAEAEAKEKADKGKKNKKPTDAADEDTEEEDEDDTDAEKPKSRSKRTFWIVMLLVVALFIGLLLVGLLPRLKKDKARKEEAQAAANALPIVTVEPAKKAPDTTRVELPANTRSNRETYVFARTNGFVQSWYADIGAKVRRGQLLAVVATPELDQQVVQARANLNLARTTYDRLRNIELPGAISRQELDQGQAQYEAQRAIVNQLLAQQAFKRVTAPFSGIVTQRSIEVGSLVSTSNAEGTQLFKLEQTDTIRAFVNVPQNFVPSIRTGLPAAVIVPEFPDRTFTGRVSREAGALVPETRTLLTEVKVPNNEQLLRPGIFAQVRFQVPRTGASVVISANTLVPGGLEQRVVMVRDKKIHYQVIEPGRDFGDELEVAKGLKGGELLVVNPTETLREGQEVEMRKPKEEKKSDGPTGAKPKSPDPLYNPNRPRVSTPGDEDKKKDKKN
ncbi:efflux RND transporter periplasmic adaptor subunit [Hymenobacter tibetensis]|uniref:Efflux RND transporter periplasmic adaptor subunit n=1 Tax=Hymenobacter tibetensis TaxID=497967 RepID=A0ABY4D0D6_9BACT|nr:efflux RND transporter periplasmic adaptor subunit [Hymenobacter tibetensis]UOG75781.1 efflux RND transporter periplasmic adaptor subunit [Hymenobacter tibetensis]